LAAATALIQARRVLIALEYLSGNVHTLNTTAQRGDPLSFLSVLSDTIWTIFDLLSALNNRWISLPKWTDRWTAELDICVPELHTQMTKIILDGLDKDRFVSIADRMTKYSKELRRLADGL